ncbi:hypothetical protein SCLCIDRAFT_804275 [Scleroderma citrinum Foug A]|uniref:Uncharacterized protein n=1 Tax=Scleroderma citrinum Foug A TaxID=1036808 RepID=A0A0C3E387_9AGAM|nr:hypothetical protein SCLCIDRAFT_804275 [Scleroderma citrinum Foug A]
MNAQAPQSHDVVESTFAIGSTALQVVTHIMYQVHFPSQSRCMTDACALPHCHLQEDHPNSCVRTRQLIPCALQRRIDFIVLSPSFIVDNSDAIALSLHNVHPR